MLARRGVAGCMLVFLIAFLVAQAALGDKVFNALFAFGPYLLLALAAIVFIAGEKLFVNGTSQKRERTARASGLRVISGTDVRAAGARTAPTGVDDLVRMLDDALRLSRPVPAVERLEPVDLADLLSGVAKRQSSARLSLRIRSRPFRTLASRPALARALEILVDNALANGTNASVECDCGTSTVVVHVDDDGPGVPSSVRPHVFEWRYYMTTPPSHQSGCGAELVIARQILRSHGGDIVIGCSPQGGARFTARLPLLGEHEVELAQAS